MKLQAAVIRSNHVLLPLSVHAGALVSLLRRLIWFSPMTFSLEFQIVSTLENPQQEAERLRPAFAPKTRPIQNTMSEYYE